VEASFIEITAFSVSKEIFSAQDKYIQQQDYGHKILLVFLSVLVS